LIGYNLIETTDGGYILAGSSHSNISGKKENSRGLEILVLKIDNSGTIVWQKTIEGTMVIMQNL
jgi:arginine repressor